MEPQSRAMEYSPLESTDSFLTQFSFAWRRKGLVLFALVIALGAGYLYFLNSEPIYQSMTQLLIIEDHANIPIEAIENRTTSEAMHISLIRSQRVIRKAVEKLNDGSLKKIREEPLTEGMVMGNLLVVGGDTMSGAILRLEYRSIYREECPLVLNAVVEAYEEFLGEMYNKTSDETVELVHNAKNQLEEQVSELESQYRQFRLDSPMVVTGATAQNIHETRLTQIEQVRSQTILENLKLRAQIDSLTSALERGSDRDALNLIVGYIDSQDGATDKTGLPADLNRIQHTHLFPMLVEQQMLVDRYGPEHPRVLEIQKRIQLTQQYIHEMAAKDAVLDPMDVETPRDYYEVYLESLREKININDQIVAEMTEQYEEERAAAKALMNYYVQDETYRAEIDRKSRMFEVILKRLEELNLIKDRSGIEMQQVHIPGLGGQVKPNLVFFMVASTALGLFAGMGLAYVVDLTDRRFRTPDDIRSDLGVAVVGNIPLIPSISKRERRAIAANHAMQPELRAVFEPRGQIAEAYRAVRTSLYFSARGGGQQVIQVTSPNPGDGKSTLAGNLAVTVANSGKRVLLMDADFRRPRCHKIFGVDNSAGVTAVIDGDFELVDVIQPSGVENLSILPCGRRPENPSELLTSRKFSELLEVLREQYDLIIIDTPPVLAVTDPLNVAPRVDGVLVVLRLTKAARASSQQTLEALEEVGAKVLGVVVNGVGGGQNYSGYGYGKKYGPRYGTPYGYRDKVAKSYYGDDPEEALEVAVAASTNGKHA